MRSSTAWLVLLAFAATLIGGFFALKSGTSGTAGDFTIGTSTPQIVATSSVEATSSAAAPQVPPRTPPQGASEYRSADHHFSIFYPSELSFKEVPDHGFALTVGFQNGAGEQGFQIYSAPINGDQITQDRFLLDEPSGVRKDPHDTSVSGAPAVSFTGFDAHLGDTYEVWFIHNGLLYEATTYKQLQPLLDQVLATWQFI